MKSRVGPACQPATGCGKPSLLPKAISSASLWQIKAGPLEFGPFCGEKSPGRIETQTNSVQILFHSDNSGENRGWKLSYAATGNALCSFPFPAPTGVGKPGRWGLMVHLVLRLQAKEGVGCT